MPETQGVPGVVVRSTGSFYKVRLAQGQLVDCTLRGKYRLEGLRTTNPIAVGDHVEVVLEETSAVIQQVLSRTNYILRKATKLSSAVQMLCANVQQALLIVTVDRPFTPLGYIDRFLVMAEAYRVPVKLIFNKLDLVLKDAKLLNKLEDWMNIYEDIGYEVHGLAATDASYAEMFRNILQGKVSFLGGQSGSGKSTLVNLVDPTLHLRTGTVSEHSEKGRHTTTFAEMHPLSFGGDVIDAPGFREFDLVGITRQELAYFFPEMLRYLPGCKFNNCTHDLEPGCAVKGAVEEGLIAESRYHTYFDMLIGIPSHSYEA